MSAPLENGAAPGETPAPAPATETAKTKTKNQPIDNNDVEHWKTRANDLVKHQGKTEAAVENPKPWHAGLFACFSPIDTCPCPAER